MRLERLFFFIVFICLLVLLCVRHGGTSFKTEIVTRDSVVVNYTYRDSVVYNVIKKDSVITDYTLVSVTEFDTITLHDTTYIAVPIASYHFTDSIADVWARGYRVTIDSVRVRWHDASTTETIFVTPRKRWLTADVGVMLLKSDVWSLSADVRAMIRVNDRWSIDGRVGVVASDRVSPYAGVGVRYALGTRRALGAE